MPYFGRGQYGIEAASRAYFGKPARELVLHQAAFIVALINRPALPDRSSGGGLPSSLRPPVGGVLMLHAGDCKRRACRQESGNGLIGATAARNRPTGRRTWPDPGCGGARRPSPPPPTLARALPLATGHLGPNRRDHPWPPRA
jgi:hypothetical protein